MEVSRRAEVPYRQLYPDTDPEAERVELRLYRQMSPARKWELVEDAIQTSRELVLAGIRLRHPNVGEEEIRRRFTRATVPSRLSRLKRRINPSSQGTPRGCPERAATRAAPTEEHAISRLTPYSGGNHAGA